MYQYVCDGCKATSDPTRFNHRPKNWGLVSFYYTVSGGRRLADHHFCQACSERLKLLDQDPNEQSQADRLLDILTDIADGAVENHSDN